MSCLFSALDESQRKWQKTKKFGGGGSHLTTTESIKSFELKYRQIAMQIFILPHLFPYLYQLGWKFLLFFSRETTLLYLLNPGTLSTHVASTAVTTAELHTLEVVVDRAAQGTPMKRDLQGANMASGLQTDLKRCQRGLELTLAPRKNRHTKWNWDRDFPPFQRQSSSWWSSGGARRKRVDWVSRATSCAPQPAVLFLQSLG